MDQLFLFITMAFPKAGMQIAGLPLTLNLLLAVYVVIRHPNQTLLTIQHVKRYAACYAIMLFFGMTTIALSTVNGISLFELSQIIIILISPLTMVSVSRISRDTLTKIVIAALLIINIYAIIQFILGVFNTAIPGLTYTYGQDLADKTNGYNVSGVANKIPSTYQVGNSLGIFNALAISYLLSDIKVQQIWKVAKNIALFSGLIGLMLCGSRSIQIPFCLILLFLLFHYIQQAPRRQKTLALASVGIGSLIFVTVLATQQQLAQHFWNRLIKQTLNDPTAAGRTTQWADGFNTLYHMPFSRVLYLLLFGQMPDLHISAEGLPKYLFTLGLVSTVAFYGGLLVLIRYCWKQPNRRTIALGLFCVFFAFCVDQSYFYPPNLMNTYIFVATCFIPQRAENFRQEPR